MCHLTLASSLIRRAPCAAIAKSVLPPTLTLLLSLTLRDKETLALFATPGETMPPSPPTPGETASLTALFTAETLLSSMAGVANGSTAVSLSALFICETMLNPLLPLSTFNFSLSTSHPLSTLSSRSCGWLPSSRCSSRAAKLPAIVSRSPSVITARPLSLMFTL